VHELSIAEGLVDLVADRTPGRQVVRVNLRVGEQCGVMVEALRFCFDVVTLSTPLEGAELHLEETAGDELDLVSVELAKEPSCA
jgi:hydrogenase nickel incorporation protein HypA/HybF